MSALIRRVPFLVLAVQRVRVSDADVFVMVGRTFEIVAKQGGIGAPRRAGGLGRVVVNRRTDFRGN